MAQFRHTWEMIEIEFGFVVFEKCTYTNVLRSYFSGVSHPEVGEEYRENNRIWRCVEYVQSFRFNMQCTRCNHVERFDNLLGFMYCTACLPSCEIEILQTKYMPLRKWVIVAVGHFPRAKNDLPQAKLAILQDYFNQRRNVRRSTIAVLSYQHIEDISKCKGEFIHDVGLLSAEPPPLHRKSPFDL
jgi:hypothetical protein